MNTINCEQYTQIHNSKVHSHLEGYGAKMNTFGKASEQLMVERLDPESISTLMID